MSLEVKKALKPVRAAFNSSDKYGKEEILQQVRLANRIIDVELENPHYSDEKKEEIKKKTQAFRDLEKELEKKLK